MRENMRQYFSLEDNSEETDKAIEIVNKQDSTDIEDVEEVQTYFETMRRIKEEQEEQEPEEDMENDDEESPSDSEHAAGGSDDQTDDPEAAEEVSQDSDGSEETSERSGQDDSSSDGAEKETESDVKKGGDVDTSMSTKEVEKASQELYHAVESLQHCLAVHDSLRKCLQYGHSRDFSIEGYLPYLKENKVLKSTLYTSLESIPTSTYSQQRNHIEYALEGIGEAIKKFLRYIWEMIKKFGDWIYSFLKSDDKASVRRAAELRAQEKTLKTLNKEAKDNIEYSEKLIAALRNKVFTSGARFMTTKSETVTIDQAMTDVDETFVFLTGFWKDCGVYLQTVVKNKLATDMDEIAKTMNVSAMQDVKFDRDFFLLNPTIATFSSNEYEQSNAFSEYGLQNRDKSSWFSLFESKAALNGGYKHIMVIPQHPIPVSANKVVSEAGHNYWATFSNRPGRRNDNEHQRSGAGVSMVTDINQLEALRRVTETRETIRNAIRQEVNQSLHQLRGLERIIGKLSTLLNKGDLLAQTEKDIRSSLNHNINCLTSIFEKPLIASLEYSKNIQETCIKFVSENSKEIEKMTKLINDRLGTENP